jgi:hypothetical protein
MDPYLSQGIPPSSTDAKVIDRELTGNGQVVKKTLVGG